MPISPPSIAEELVSVPSALGLAIVVAMTQVLIAIIKSDSPVTRAIAELLRRRRAR